MLDPEKRKNRKGGPLHIPMEALTGKKHQCPRYIPPIHSGRDYNLHNPLEFEAVMKRIRKKDMEKGKVWCIRCDMAHSSKAPCFWLREIGFIPHTDYYPKEEWTQPMSFFKQVHRFISDQAKAGRDPGNRPRDLQKRKILAADSSEKIF